MPLLKLIYTITTAAIIVCGLTILPSAKLHAQGYLKADGKKIVNEKGENVLLRGVGLGGWMLQEGYMLRINNEGQQYRIRERFENLIGAERTQEFYDLWLANHTRKIDIDSMKAWGFNSVRLPMHYNLYTLPVDKEPVAGQDTWLEKGFAMTDSLLAWCKANKMYLILDLHAAPGGQGNDLNISDRDPSKPSLWDSEANQKKTIALWKKIAERYVDEPWIGAYDIINEPNWGFDDPTGDKNGTKEKRNIPLKKLMVDITSAIREVDKKHMVIIEGNGWGNNYNGILPQWDDNMVLSFHKYWSYNDQGSAENMIKMREQYNIPVWLGETGENSNVWFTEAIRLFEKNNIGWAWWPLKKLGFNNPMEVRSNKNYDQVLRFISRNEDKPAADSVYKGLKELAENVRLENTIIHKDVIDAMMRQPFTAETKPFKVNKINRSAVVQSVDYDLGINGAAYFDLDTADYHVSTGKNTPGNRGRVYRNDGVDIGRDANGRDNYYVTNFEKGEWLQYTIDVAKAGDYKLVLNFATADSDAAVSATLNGKLFAEAVKLPNTDGLTQFKELEFRNSRLSAGKHKIRIFSTGSSFNFSYIRFVE
ncbi:cellulase family glycosylhydrolase [Pedobacter psychroterrae]|uniref:Carbohydrate-binding protein n=1 Tax=Pedobacter psychroterrae TaxID=2530453 RepID=A0A4V2ML15_9SPHI|nr:cellulase family glycosylhydrolase [Pedobacter psychroterrae]TCD00347.1 carbohydrate-binding protein [Pedobacter psychroterrae]